MSLTPWYNLARKATAGTGTGGTTPPPLEQTTFTPLVTNWYADTWGPSVKSFIDSHGFGRYSGPTQASFTVTGNPDLIDNAKVTSIVNALPQGATIVWDLESYPWKVVTRAGSVGTLTAAAYEAEEKKIRDLLILTKQLRPDVKVGMYDIPKAEYYDGNRLSRNGADNTQYDAIMELSDVVAPALYTNFVDPQQITHARQLQYLDATLEQALSYAGRFDMEVMPYVWQRNWNQSAALDPALPYGITYELAYLRQDTFAQYIKRIRDYTHANGKKASGVLWYDLGVVAARRKQPWGAGGWNIPNPTSATQEITDSQVEALMLGYMQAIDSALNPAN